MDTSALDIIVKVISSLGFPIFVAVWMLLRTDKLLGEMNALLREILVHIKREDKTA